jgi:hypothetical protein
LVSTSDPSVRSCKMVPCVLFLFSLFLLYPLSVQPLVQLSSLRNPALPRFTTATDHSRYFGSRFICMLSSLYSYSGWGDRQEYHHHAHQRRAARLPRTAEERGIQLYFEAGPMSQIITSGRPRASVRNREFISAAFSSLLFWLLMPLSRPRRGIFFGLPERPCRNEQSPHASISEAFKLTCSPFNVTRRFRPNSMGSERGPYDSRSVISITSHDQLRP